MTWNNWEIIAGTRSYFFQVMFSLSSGLSLPKLAVKEDGLRRDISRRFLKLSMPLITCILEHN